MVSLLLVCDSWSVQSSDNTDMNTESDVHCMHRVQVKQEYISSYSSKNKGTFYSYTTFLYKSVSHMQACNEY